ncbi:SulP family inorganic anion transporter [Silvibacterium sp.]|uniref:SulP family inorganic anion transporter n=1 Tax=Silvibacterium sp. TaxID=1964179 RepID=UPI0039E26EE0
MREIRTNLLSGVTVSLALVPEAIAFSLIAHLNPLQGMYAAFLMCFIAAAFGGRPGLISGAAGSTAVVMVALVVQHGVQYLFAALVLMGVLQAVFGLLRFGKFIRMVPHPVMLGFVNGLAIIIAKAQLVHFHVKAADGAQHWMTGKPLMTMLALVAATIVVIYALPRLTKAIPASLAAIVVVTLCAVGLGIHTKTVGDMASIRGSLPHFHVPGVSFTFETLKIIAPYSLILAGVGLIETLLTLNLVDEMTGTRGRPNRESLAQGIGNIACGFFGGMGGCAMIGQTMINVGAGGMRRLSGMFSGLCLLSYVLFGSSLIERIPIAALVGLMFVVAMKTFAWGSFRIMGKIPRHDAFVIVAVTVVTVFTDLATAVVLGILIAALVFAWEHAKQISVSVRMDCDGRKIYELTGSVFFASAAQFRTLFSPETDPEDVIIEFRQARVMDHSALEAIETLAEKYREAGKRLHLRHLSPDCYALLDKAKGMVEVNAAEDPTYAVADNRLG